MFINAVGTMGTYELNLFKNASTFQIVIGKDFNSLVAAALYIL